MALMSPDTDPDPFAQLTQVNQRVSELGAQLPSIIAQLSALKDDQISEGDVSAAFQSVETFWEDLFPLERNRLIHLLVEQIEIRESGIDMTLKTNGLTNLVAELVGMVEEAQGRTE